MTLTLFGYCLSITKAASEAATGADLAAQTTPTTPELPSPTQLPVVPRSSLQRPEANSDAANSFFQQLRGY